MFFPCVVILHALNCACHSVNAVAFSSDGKCVVSGSDDMTLKTWDASTGALLSTFSGHSFRCVFPCVFPLIVFALLVLSRVLTCACHSVTSVAYSSDGKTIVSGSNDETVKIWNASTGELQSTLRHSDR